MDISWYRKRLMECPKYTSVSWSYKVSRMSDSQVFAVYHKFMEKGYFDKPKTVCQKFKETGYFDKRKKEKKEEYRQMTIFDYIDA